METNSKTNEILACAVGALRKVTGVEGVVLGGSRARGTHTDGSDIDIGIYYDKARLSLEALEEAARLLDDESRPRLVAPPGAWGPWVNGGAWLVVDGLHVDFILRDTARVQTVVEECEHGIVYANYQTGHPHAYISAMYRGELAVSKLLWDAGELAALKVRAELYPAKLKAAMTVFFLFEAGFSHGLAAASAVKDDLYYTMAHLVRAVSCLNQVIFAHNEVYCLNEKKAVHMIEGFARKPAAYKLRVDEIFALASREPVTACGKLLDLIKEAKAL